MDPLPPGLPVQAYANPLGEDLGAPEPLDALDPLDALPSGMRDYLALQPVPPTTPDLLGLGAPPAPPAPPPMLGPKGSNVGDLVALAMAAFLGPGKGTGILQGVQASRMQAEQARQQLAEQHQQIYAQRQRMWQWEQQQYAADAQRRQQTLEQNVKALQSAIPTLKTKADYDRTLDTFTAGLQAMGLRVDGNYLRSRVPYISKDGAERAREAIERWRKNPQNERTLLEHPEQAALAKIPLDRDGDGKPEMVILDEAMALGEMPFTKDKSGKIVWFPKGTSKAAAMSDEAELEDLMAIARAEGKDVDSNTPPAVRLRQALRDQVQAKRLKRMSAEARARHIETPKEPSLIQVTEADPRTGELVTSLVPKVPGEVSRRKPAPKEPNQGQFMSAGYATRIEQAGEVLDRLESAVAGMPYARFTAQSVLPAAAQSAVYQSYDQAARNLVNAILRRESGAAISASEFDNARRQYLPQPGDTPTTLAQKKQNRMAVLQNLKTQAGGAYQPPPTDGIGGVDPLGIR